jgi:predicted TPR repeat methyltransferase
VSISHPLDLARAAFFEGVAHFEAERFLEAHASFVQALDYAPERASIQLNLGVTLVRLGRFSEAIPLLDQALISEKASADGWAALALALSEVSLWTRCAKACETLFSLKVEQLPLYLLHARSLASTGRIKDAMSAYKKALDLDKSCAEAWYQLANLQRETGEDEDARTSYSQALAHGADVELIEYMLAALNKSSAVLTPPRAYVQNLFDQYANDFERHLVGELGYCGHTLLIEKIPATAPKGFESVLDLGCGTGLCAALLRPRSSQLVGVDLAPEMIEKSRQTALYDELLVSDIHDYLSTTTKYFDLVVAADVFIYVGELDRLFALLKRRMNESGWLGFTVELPTDTSAVQLMPSLRYAHSVQYVQALAQRHGFEVASGIQAPIRVHNGQPMMGQYWYMQYLPSKQS